MFIFALRCCKILQFCAYIEWTPFAVIYRFWKYITIFNQITLLMFFCSFIDYSLCHLSSSIPFLFYVPHTSSLFFFLPPLRHTSFSFTLRHLNLSFTLHPCTHSTACMSLRIQWSNKLKSKRWNWPKQRRPTATLEESEMQRSRLWRRKTHWSIH